MAAPTLIQTAQTPNWEPSAFARTSAAITFAAGDLIVVRGFQEDNGTTFTTPTATGLTFAIVAGFPTTVASKTKNYVWQATAASGGSSIIVSTSASAQGDFAGIVVTVWRAHGGIGAVLSTPAQGTSSAPSGTITTTAANSAIDAMSGDWSASAGATGAWRTTSATPGTGDIYQRDTVGTAGSHATYYAATYPDAGSAGAKTIGVSTPTTQNWLLNAVEILGVGGGGGSTIVSPVQTFGPSYAAQRAASI